MSTAAKGEERSCSGHPGTESLATFGSNHDVVGARTETEGGSWRARLGRVIVLICLISGCLLLAGPTAIGQQPQVFRSTVQLVQLQVSVVGADGEFLQGLGEEDFRITVDGESRPAQVVYEVDLRPSAVADTTTTATIAAPDLSRPVAARRHFLVLFDLVYGPHKSRRWVLEARKEALDFIREGVHRLDLVAVATITRTGINLLSPFVADHSQALAAVESLGLRSATGQIPLESEVEEVIADNFNSDPAASFGNLDQVPAMEYRAYVAGVANYLDQLRQMAEMLQAVEGKKHVVMFTHGFADRALTGLSLEELSAGANLRSVSPGGLASAALEMQSGDSGVREDMGRVVKALRQADAVIHAVDTAGLAASIGPVAVRPTRQSLSTLALDTGGTLYLNTNDFAVPLAAIEQTTAAFYMIGYRRSPNDPPTVEVSVQIIRPGARVVSAPTALSPPPEYRQMTPSQRQLQLAEFMNDDVERRRIDFQAQVVPLPGKGEGRVAVLLEVPGAEVQRLALERNSEQIQLEFGAFSLDESGRPVGATRRGVTIDVAELRARGPIAAQRFLLSDSVQARPGEGRLRLLLREAEIGQLSSRTIRFWSPEPSSTLALARPFILSGMAAPLATADGGGFDPFAYGEHRLLPLAAPVVQAGATVRMLLVAWNLQLHPPTGQTVVGLTMDLTSADGEAHRVQSLAIVDTLHDAESGVTRLLVEATMPAAMPVGTGHLWVRLLDRVAGRRVEEQVQVRMTSTEHAAEPRGSR